MLNANIQTGARGLGPHDNILNKECGAKSITINNECLNVNWLMTILACMFTNTAYECL
jgi:hypothetical protein